MHEAVGFVNDFLADDGLNKGGALFVSMLESVDRTMPKLREVTIYRVMLAGISA
jgi:hypothetical protein